MKNLMKSLILVLLASTTIVVFTSAKFKPSSKTYPGVVYFSNGKQIECAAVQLPYSGMKKIKMATLDQPKRKKEVNVDDIVKIRFWVQGKEDVQSVLFHVHNKKGEVSSGRDWGWPIAQSSWGVVYRCYRMYKMDKDSGRLMGVYEFDAQDHLKPVIAFLWREGDKLATPIMEDDEWYYNTRVANMFRDDKTISQGIRKLEIQPKDIQKLLDRMATSAK